MNTLIQLEDIMTTYILTGTIIDTSDSPGGLHVEAWDTSDTVTDNVAYAKTDADGRFSLSLTDEDITSLYTTGVPNLELRVLADIPFPGEGTRRLTTSPALPTWNVYDKPKTERIVVDTSTGPSEALQSFRVRGRVDDDGVSS